MGATAGHEDGPGLVGMWPHEDARVRCLLRKAKEIRGLGARVRAERPDPERPGVWCIVIPGPARRLLRQLASSASAGPTAMAAADAGSLEAAQRVRSPASSRSRSASAANRSELRPPGSRRLCSFGGAALSKRRRLHRRVRARGGREGGVVWWGGARRRGGRRNGSSWRAGWLRASWPLTMAGAVAGCFFGSP